MEIELENGDKVLSKLIVGSDGKESSVKKIAGISSYGWSYQ